MRRREFMAGLGGSAAWPLVARGQQASRVARIGFLVTGSLAAPDMRVTIDAFQQALRQLGYIEGQNIVTEYREAHGNVEHFANLATELVRAGVDLIVAPNTPAARAARQATTTTPVVAAAMGNPVADGLVSSLARPGGNVTGLTFLGPELTSKRLQLLKEALPNLSRVGALWHREAYGARTMNEMLETTDVAAQALRLQLQPVGVRGPAELDSAFFAMIHQDAQAVLVLPSPAFYVERRRIADLALRYRLASTFVDREFVQVGGFIAYGASLVDLFRRSATYVDKILKGAKPGDLPVEQPTKFDLAINLKTAKALGLEMPPTLLARADEVIE
jgi:putative tryptophan/tyrosine transport system substrate-binding protein